MSTTLLVLNLVAILLFEPALNHMASCSDIIFFAKWPKQCPAVTFFYFSLYRKRISLFLFVCLFFNTATFFVNTTLIFLLLGVCRQTSAVEESASILIVLLKLLTTMKHDQNAGNSITERE